MFFVYRDVKNGHFKYCCETRLRKGDENKIIHDRLIPYSRLNTKLYWMMYNNARHFYVVGHQSRWWKKLDRLLYELNSTAVMMRCCNKVFRGDLLITSDPKSYPYIPQKQFFAGHGFRFKFLYSDPPVPPHTILQTCTGDTNFDKPIVACPIINKAKFLEFCDAKNCHIENIPVVTFKNTFPITQRYYQIYKLYEEYINEFPPEWWYIENLGGDLAQHYYTTIRFYDSKTPKGFERKRHYKMLYRAERMIYNRRLRKEKEAHRNSNL